MWGGGGEMRCGETRVLIVEDDALQRERMLGWLDDDNGSCGRRQTDERHLMFCERKSPT